MKDRDLSVDFVVYMAPGIFIWMYVLGEKTISGELNTANIMDPCHAIVETRQMHSFMCVCVGSFKKKVDAFFDISTCVLIR